MVVAQRELHASRTHIESEGQTRHWERILKVAVHGDRMSSYRALDCFAKNEKYGLIKQAIISMKNDDSLNIAISILAEKKRYDLILEAARTTENKKAINAVASFFKSFSEEQTVRARMDGEIELLYGIAFFSKANGKIAREALEEFHSTTSLADVLSNSKVLLE